MTGLTAIAPQWNPTYRLVPSRFPPISLFEAVASPEDFDAIFAVQALVNPRVRQQVGQIDLVPKADRVFGAGSSPIMAAFCHLNPEGSRFADGTWGVYYGAQSLETAVAEVSYHRAKFLAATDQLPIDVDLRCYVATVQTPLVDVRSVTDVHEPDSYAASRELAKEQRTAGAAGLLYNSVRDPGRECVAVFRPNAIKVPVTQGPHVTLSWDGQRIRGWYRKSDAHDL
ncbi:RES family NAD+ phosphorylase [Roseateles sp. DC23W]|uniref:RES family NAD+ phosphorylase n=1 Tax=Pelomonas dachongensis TaxID=3299029 RepID=A0ABW7EVR4_9BURK